MKDNYTHITLVCDRSGSMAAVQSDAEGAVNQFIEDQKKVDAECTLTLVDFDAMLTADKNWYRQIYQGPIADCPKYILAPRGNTALHDAVGRSITETGEYLAAMDESDRPSKVVFVVQTDGYENSSKDWTLDKIRELIKQQESDYQWQFVFLGMGPDTFAQGHAMGMSNVVQAANTGAAHGSTQSTLSAYTVDYRLGTAKNMAAANYAVDAKGKVFDKDGNEIDPQTGKRLDIKA